MKNTLYTLTGLMVLLFAAFNLTGCSITDPSENFEVVIEGEVEKDVIESQSYTADPVQMTVLQNTQLGGGTPAPRNPKDGGATIAGADVLEAAVEANLGTINVRWVQSMVLFATGNKALIQVPIQGTFVNDGTASVTITVYFEYESGIGISILDSTEEKAADFVIPAGQSRSISSWDDFDNDYINVADVRNAVLGVLNSGNLFLYVSAESDADVDVTIQQVNVTFPAVTQIQKQVTPDDLQDYTLEELNSVALKGTIVNNGAGQIDADFYLSIDELDLNNLDRDRYAAFDLATNGTFNFATDSYFLAAGQDTLMARFTQLFPPNNQTLEFTAWFSSSSAINVTVNNLGVVANARIEVDQ